MPYIDANIILRYVLNDHAELSPKAKLLIGENIVEMGTQRCQSQHHKLKEKSLKGR